jgi:hypothetical protein
MSERIVCCPKCSAIVPAETLRSAYPGVWQPCGFCHAELLALAFPALVKDGPASGPGENALGTEDTTCFYHAQKQAIALCDSCGRFLCALCDLKLNGQHLCPACLAAGKKKGKLRNLDQERLRHDGIALVIALLPISMWPFTLITAPIAVFYSFRHWNSPGSLLGRSRTRFVFAILFGLAESAVWIYFIAFFFLHHSARTR